MSDKTEFSSGAVISGIILVIVLIVIGVSIGGPVNSIVNGTNNSIVGKWQKVENQFTVFEFTLFGKYIVHNTLLGVNTEGTYTTIDSNHIQVRVDNGLPMSATGQQTWTINRSNDRVDVTFENGGTMTLMKIP